MIGFHTDRDDNESDALTWGVAAALFFGGLAIIGVGYFG